MVVDKGPLKIGGITPSPTDKAQKPSDNKASGFGELLKDKISQKPSNSLSPESSTFGVKFSQHALERMQSRGISLKPDELSKLGEAIDKAAQKGSRETLVLMGDNALIVSVKNKTVVTAMDKDAMRDNVFTNIDSTVIL